MSDCLQLEELRIYFFRLSAGMQTIYLTNSNVVLGKLGSYLILDPENKSNLTCLVNLVKGVLLEI